MARHIPPPIRRKPSGSVAGTTIKVTSELTKIPIGTLRAWERRYGFPKPARRADSNRRLYAPEQIEHLKVVVAALARGYRPGDVIRLPTAELQALLRQVGGSRRADSLAIADVPQLISLLVEDDAKGVEDQLRLAAAALGAKRFITDVAQPLSKAVGEAWADGALAIRQEHLMTECLTTQLRALLATHLVADGAPTVVLATLPGEPHTLGLQMVALYLALSGARPRLLGAGTPTAQLVSAATAFDASIVGVAVSPVVAAAATRRELRRLSADLPDSTSVWVGGSGAARLGRLPPRAELLLSWGAIDMALASARRAG